jgi:hypothetical protein
VPAVTIAEIADPGFLKWIWRKRVRDQLRTPRLQDFELGHDPSEGLAFDWELDAAVASLCRDLSSGEYRAGAAEVIQAAKGKGLTRSLAFMRPPDILVYRAIVYRAETALMKKAKPWTRFGRRDRSDQSDGSGTSDSGWFRDWLRREGQIWAMTETHEWLVETDIANFFPSIDLPNVLRHVQANSELDEEVVSLLGHMLEQFAPLLAYQRPPTVGLPQENYDSSRVIAHTYLKVVDDEFDAEGRANRYSRWMDDIVIGVGSRNEALQIIRRIQFSLARLGLYPNSAKTRVYSKGEFAIDYMKAENDHIGEIDRRFEGAQTYDRTLFRARLRKHLSSRGQGYRAWERVLRRYYTSARRFHDPSLTKRAFVDLVQTSSSARHVFDYLSTFPVTVQRHEELLDALASLGGVYEDVDLLAHEYVCSAPNRLSPALGKAIADWAMSQVESCLANDVVSQRLGAAACLSVGKFGEGEHFDSLLACFQRMRGDTVLRQQALLVLIGSGRISIGEVNSIAVQFGRERDRTWPFSAL